MTATAKKVLSVFMAFVLVFAFTPTAAFGDLEGETGTEKQGETLEANDLPLEGDGVQDDGKQAGEGQDDGKQAGEDEQGNGGSNEYSNGSKDPEELVELDDPVESEQPATVVERVMTTMSESDTAITVQTEYDIHGGNYQLGYITGNFTFELGGEQKSFNGAFVTDVNVWKADTDVVIPRTIGDNNVPVVGVARTSGEASELTGAGNVRNFTFPSSIQFVNIDLHSAHGTVVFEETDSGNNKPITMLTRSSAGFFEYFGGSGVTLPDHLATVSSQMFHRAEITEIDIPSSVTAINYEAFYGAYKLSSVTLHEGLETIGDWAFASEESGGSYYYGNNVPLATVSIPSTVTSIGNQAFAKDMQLTTLEFAGTPSLTTIGDEAFYGTSLESVSIPNSVTSIGKGAFSGKNGTSNIGDTNPNQPGDYTLKTIKLGTSQDASNLTTLGSKAFAHQPITSIELPNSLTSLGYDKETFLFDNNGVLLEANSGQVSQLGAFSHCDQLSTIKWPNGNTFKTVGGFDNCTSLTDDAVNSLPSSVERIDNYAFYNCTSLSNVVIPRTVTSIGMGAFGQSSAPATNATKAIFSIQNAETSIEWNGTDVSTGPWRLGCGTTIRYPLAAAADSSIVAYRDAVEKYESEHDVSDVNKTRFETIETLYEVTGTVPKGATVTLVAGSEVLLPELDASNSFSTWIEKGKYVGATISLDGYIDKKISPDPDKDLAKLTTDWNFTVTTGGTDGMTPLLEAGMLQVMGKGLGRAECNVAVFTSAGKLVEQGSALRASEHPDTTSYVPIYVVDTIPADTYTVVAWEKNEYFSHVSSLNDFAAMGIHDNSYAKANVTVAKSQTATVELDIPKLDTSAISGVLATGEVYVKSLYNPPAVPFVLYVNYDMTTGQKVDSVKVNIPAGLEPVAAASTAKDYGVSGWNDTDRVLTISGLAEADQQSSALSIGLKATTAGSYSVSASVTSGRVVAPLGGTSIECPDIQLVVPQGTLTSKTFDVDVYARPNSEITLKIGNTELGVDKKTLNAACKTNLIGHAKVTVTIPDEELVSAYYYEVTATTKVGDADVSDKQTVQYSSWLDGVPLEPTIYNFSFDSAGTTYDLVKDGKDMSGGYYIVGVHEDNFTRSMPFSVTIDSLQPLEDGATLYLGMLDNSVKDYAMSQSGDAVELPNGAMRYTFETIVPITEDNEFDLSEIPCRFDVSAMPKMKASATSVIGELTSTRSDALFSSLNQEAWALEKQGEAAYKSWYGTLSEANQQLLNGKKIAELANTADSGITFKKLTDNKYDWTFGIFNNSFRHEKWCTDAEWNNMSAEERKELLEAEDDIAAALDYLAVMMGNEKPMYEYESFEAYAAAEYYYSDATSAGTMANDLEGMGYIVTYDSSGNIKMPAKPESFNKTWYDKSTEKYNWPEPTSSNGTWVASNIVPNESSASSTKNALTAQNADPRESDDIDAVSNFGDWYYILAHMPKTRSEEQRAKQSLASGLNDLVGNLSAGQTGPEMMLSRGALAVVGLYSNAVSAEDSFQDAAAANDELNIRKDELGRMQAMYDMYAGKGMSQSDCAKALKEEMEYLEAYISDLKKQVWFTGITGTVGTVSGEVAAGAALAAEGLQASAIYTATSGSPAAEALEGAAATAGSVSLIATAVSIGNTIASHYGGKLLIPHLADHKANVDNYRIYRERVCKKDDFGRLHYNKKPIQDPSGWTYEGVDSNRVSDVIATIWQKTGDDAWTVWNAEDYDQVNGQRTDQFGRYGWDVPYGDWKVLFEKEGYDSVWSQVMHVPPAWMNVAINMIRSDPPAGASDELNMDNPEAPYVDITFNQYMKTAGDFAPTVTVNGVAVTDSTWVGATAGTDENGNEVMLSLVLRVPLAAFTDAEGPLEIVVSDAYSYAGKKMETPYATTVTIPVSYYYVTPAEPVVYTKGSNEAKTFAFKRTVADSVTFERFAGILVDGKAVDADNYTAVAGSVVVTLKASFLETLAEGSHTLTAQFSDGSATAEFTVVAKAAPATAASWTRPAAATPATGDQVVPMSVLLVVAVIAGCVVFLSHRRASAAKPVVRRRR